jgi:hypothetical protein
MTTPASDLLREVTRLRAQAWRKMIRAAAMLRQADALEDGLATQQNFTVARCVGCRTAFPIWAEEQAWLTSKGLSLPKRCRDCRLLRARQKRKQAERAAQSKEHASDVHKRT